MSEQLAEPLTMSARLAAPVSRVRAALTEAGELRAWLSEHAEVDLPNRFAFWGPSIPDGAEPHQRPLTVTDTEVSFAWQVGGEETTVEFTLAEESADTTVLTASQSHFPGWGVAASGGGGVLAVLGTFWAAAIANLVEHIEGRPLTPRGDLTSADLKAEVVIAASAEKIYDALMDPAKFAEWFGYPIELEPHVGGRWAMGGFENNPSPAKIVELEPGRALTLDFGGSSYGLNSWELAESDGKTRLTFMASGFNRDNPPYAGWLGWISGIAELRRYVEMPDWRMTWIVPTEEETRPAE
ncbi:SRPBCC family protein [Actinokineospora iranica]|uniref:Activator of Hsp90 ATPase homolog 1-like protein n=1 Tax=Actinokineospora iranica TaxID=1271860 RepID=A0A1G6RY39_9PSEU|nr:SRPBCC family protein [Actinokineospora iranica]SDD08845.1 Activator of Hsp90 ATPase homolog 1-like protein [Actinokineospora iranica]